MSNTQSRLWAIVFGFYTAKFVLVCAVLATFYNDMRGWFGSLQITKLDLFSIKTGLGYKTLEGALGKFRTERDQVVVYDKLVEKQEKEESEKPSVSLKKVRLPESKRNQEI